jgi:pimeloyl-ACP methyl ester carboxylesterase
MSVTRNDRLRIVHILLVCAIVLSAFGMAAAPASADGAGCDDGEQSSGAKYRICMPAEWNGDLVVFAHGYVAPENPIAIPEDQLELEDGTSIPGVVTGLGYAFATTSYSDNGLVAAEAIEDLVDLVSVFADEESSPENTYLVGASEGGLITALATEQHPDAFDGGVAACGPVGDFRRQVNYWGDVRVLFDYFFPKVFGKYKFVPEQDPLIPQTVIDSWYYCGDPDRNENYGCVDSLNAAYQTKVQRALATHPRRTEQLLRVADVPINWSDPAANVGALVQLLWYNVFAANDAVEKLDGQPYDNGRTWYWGSDNDWRLNRKVERFTADPEALGTIDAIYQTSGDLSVPIVTLHALQDPIVPYWHEPLYRWKVWRHRDYALHTNIPSLRYGHCSFSAGEVLFAFGLLVYQVSGEGLLNVRDVLTPSQLRDYKEMERNQNLEQAPEKLIPKFDAPVTKP